VTDTLSVHVSKGELHSLEVPTSFEAAGSFDVRLVNHGQALHVHLHLDETLSQIADLDAGNHYVEGDSERRIRVEVHPERLNGEEVLGKLKVASGYGAETRWIDVAVSEPDPEKESVEVDESLATPQPKDEDGGGPGLGERLELPLLGLGALAVALAFGAALLVGQFVVVLGSGILLAGVVVAAFFLLRDRPPTG
jgi:hypothetical protein